MRLIGFEQSLSVALEFSQGSEAAQFKAKQTITAGFTSTQETTAEKEKTSERAAPSSSGRGASGRRGGVLVHDVPSNRRRSTPPGSAMSPWASASAPGKPARAGASSASGRPTTTNTSATRTTRTGGSTSYRLIKADGGQRDWDCWQWFRDHPAPEWLTDRLKEPLALPFDHTSPPYDGHVSIEPHKRIIRVNEAINPELHAKWLANMAAAVE